jgi:signal transduction histidine kinase
MDAYTFMHPGVGMDRGSIPPRTAALYNKGMHESALEDMKQSIGFTDEDAARVRSLSHHAARLAPAVVERFYDELLRQPGAAVVFSGGAEQIHRLRETLSDWLGEVFAGVYDRDYFEKRLRIGRAHVRVGLAQHFMVAGMEIIWTELERGLSAGGGDGTEAALRSLHKALMLDLAIMLESYKESHSEQARTLERRAVKEQLTRAEHLAEIGQLAASLAHEIKNPLAGISGAIQIMRDGMRADDPHRPIVNEILGQISRLDATVKDLLFYARPNPPRATTLGLSDVVTRVLTLLREEPSLQRVRIIHEPGPPDAAIHADDTQIEQLLMNLILNAAHASPDGGAVHLRITKNADRVRLTVTDKGTGMAPDVRDQAFEPFFTTKAKGTGLGLSICRRIVDAHGGSIELESELGRGTRVIVDLPGGGPARLQPVGAQR